MHPDLNMSYEAKILGAMASIYDNSLASDTQFQGLNFFRLSESAKSCHYFKEGKVTLIFISNNHFMATVDGEEFSGEVIRAERNQLWICIEHQIHHVSFFINKQDGTVPLWGNIDGYTKLPAH